MPALIGALCLALAGSMPPSDADMRARCTRDVEAGRPLVVHVIVALCDNEAQGIVPVPAHLGNGQDPNANLYWGAQFGVRTFFTRKAGWETVAPPEPHLQGLLERIVLHKHLIRDGQSVDVYLVAEAWDGRSIKPALARFANLAAGHEVETVEIGKGESAQRLRAGGTSHLVAYVGHNGLMDFALPQTPSEADNAPPRGAIVLACASKPYFLDLLRKAGAEPVLLTTGLMAPEAYTLDAAIGAWAKGENAKQIQSNAGAVYHKYQQCGLTGATRLFYSESPQPPSSE